MDSAAEQRLREAAYRPANNIGTERDGMSAQARIDLRALLDAYDARGAELAALRNDLGQEIDTLRAALREAVVALAPIAHAVFNDNGEMTVGRPEFTHDEIVRAYFRHKRLSALLKEGST